MIHQELTQKPHHYAVLLIGESLLFTAFVSTRDPVIQLLLSWAIGVFYFFWGVFSHEKALRTGRLMLEYALVGLLATMLLLVILGNI